MDVLFRTSVVQHVDQIVKRAETMACKLERETVITLSLLPYLDLSHLQATSGLTNMTGPVIQTVTNLISSATNPLQLTKMGELYQPWF